MAEAIARSLAPSTLQCWSAGSEPYQVRPQVPLVLAELGINSEALFSKGLDAVPLDESSLLVTLCAEQICPATPGVRALHWPIDDPATGPDSEEPDRLQRFREARDEIKARLQELLPNI